MERKRWKSLRLPLQLVKGRRKRFRMLHLRLLLTHGGVRRWSCQHSHLRLWILMPLQAHPRKLVMALQRKPVSLPQCPKGHGLNWRRAMRSPGLVNARTTMPGAGKDFRTSTRWKKSVSVSFCCFRRPRAAVGIL